MGLPTYKCTRCQYKWHPRTNKKPKVCANKKCKSPYWDKPRRLSTPKSKATKKAK